MVKGKERRTVVGNSSTLGEVETVRTLESGDLPMWELCEKVWLFVVLEMLVISHDFELKATESGDAPDLCRVRGDIERVLAIVRTTFPWRCAGTE